MRFALLVAAAVSILVIASYVAPVQVQAGPSGCGCTTWARLKAANQTAGVHTCSGCPNSSRCSSLPKGTNPMDGSPLSSSACILSDRADVPRNYQSVRKACESGNFFFYNWDPPSKTTPGGGNVKDCHFAGYPRYFSDGSKKYHYGLPWCQSAVDHDGALTGKASDGLLAIMFVGAPSWRYPDERRFHGYAEDLNGNYCIFSNATAKGTAPPIAQNALPYNRSSTESIYRAYTPTEINSLPGFESAGSSVHVSFCTNGTTGVKTISKHSCAYYDVLQ